MNRIKYLLGVLTAIPLLPFMKHQGTKIRKSVPQLAEAIEPIATVGKGELFSLLVLGESTMAGVGVKSHRQGFTGHLAQELSQAFKAKVTYEVKARSGYTAKQVTKKLVPKIEMSQPDLIVIGLGANDAFTLNTPWRWEKDCKELIVSLREKFNTAPIVFLNMPPIKEFPAMTGILRFTIGNLVDILGKELHSLTKDRSDQTYYISEKIRLKKWLKKFDINKSPEDLYSDGIHPSELTYEVWAKNTMRYLKTHSLF